MTLGYVLSRYPLLSETFILREMWEMERQGHGVCVYPLLKVRGRHHARVEQLRAPVWRAPWLPLGAHVRWLRRRPRTYLATLGAVLWYNRGDAKLWLGAVVYWGKAVAIAERLQADGIEHVHAHYATHPALVAWVAHRLTGIPYSFTVHAHDIFCHRAMLPQKLRAARVAIAISDFNRRRLEDLVPLPRPPIAVVHCGVETQQYAEMAAARTPPPSREELRILTVGSLQPYKGQRHLVDACARLRERGIAFTCRIVGAGELARSLRRQIAQHGLQAYVHLAGAATEAEVGQALAWADVFAMPSIRMPNGKMEGVPVALMEAMAAGLPVVASRLSGIPELLENGRCGLLVPAGNAGALAHALARLGDADLRQRLAERGRRRIAEEFELADNVARLARVWALLPASHEVAA